MKPRKGEIAEPEPRFALGDVLITSNAALQLDMMQVARSIRRHVRGDWGDVCTEDENANDVALVDGERIVSVYGDGAFKFYIITEADRSVTTVLMPEDY